MNRVSARVFAFAILPAVLLHLPLGAASATGPKESEATEPRESTLVVGSLNVHYIAEGQERLAWENRREAVAAAIRLGSPDIMAFQEMETFEGGHFNVRNVQLGFLRERFPEYEYAATGDPTEYPFTQPVMYRKRKFQPLEQGFFFFSPTPDVFSHRETRVLRRKFDGAWPSDHYPLLVTLTLER